MKILMFSDLHVFAHLNKTQFEDIAINFLVYLLNYCKKNKIDKVMFLGDFFHIKNKLYVPPFIRSIDMLRSFRAAGIDITFLIGNHDAPQMNSTDHSIIYSFKEYGTVIPLYDWEDIDGIRFHYLSYTDELPKFEMAEKNVLIGHLDIKNFVMEGTYICDSGFDMKSFKAFDHVISGHFHKHQILKNITYVGSPYQTRFSERNDKKGFIEFDTKEYNWKFIEYKEAPIFKELNIENYDSEDIVGNFIRIKTHKNNDDLITMKNKLLLLGAESVDFIFEDENEEKELNMIEELTMGSMTQLSSEYFDNVEESELFPKNINDLLNDKKLFKKDFLDVFKDIEEKHLSGWKGTGE